jgi:hypothetical protein
MDKVRKNNIKHLPKRLMLFKKILSSNVIKNKKSFHKINYELNNATTKLKSNNSSYKRIYY